MIKPEPQTYRCPACKWQHRVAPRSDALIEGTDVFRICPRCGHAPLEVYRENSGLSAWWSRWRR